MFQHPAVFHNFRAQMILIQYLREPVSAYLRVEVLGP